MPLVFIINLLYLVCVDLVLILVSVAIAIICLKNFNLGLMNHSNKITCNKKI